MFLISSHLSRATSCVYNGKWNEWNEWKIHPQLEVYATRVHWRVVLLSFGKIELSGSWTRSQFIKVGLGSQLCNVCTSALQCRLEATRFEHVSHIRPIP